MIRQLGEGEKDEKRHHYAPETLKAGTEELDPTDTLEDDEIDPAEFFDPEEFGIRRRDFKFGFKISCPSPK